MNDIFHSRLCTTKPLFKDCYKRNCVIGRLILINEGTIETVAAGMIQ